MSQDPKVIIYSTKWCVFCKIAKDYLTGKGVAYKEVNVENDMEKARELVERTGQAGVPVIEIGDETILGFDRQRIDLALRHYNLVK